MKPTIYLDSSVPSYWLEQGPDPIIQGRHLITRKWWANDLPRFDAYISQVVLDELIEGVLMDIDPVVEEMRQHGARIAQECGGDIRKMAERFRKEQEQHPHRVVNLRKRFSPGETPPTSTQTTPD